MEGLTAFRGSGSRQLRDAEKRAERRRRLEERSANLFFNLPSVPSNGLGFSPDIAWIHPTLEPNRPLEPSLTGFHWQS